MKRKFFVKIIAVLLAAVFITSCSVACKDKEDGKKRIMEFEYYINKVAEFAKQNEEIIASGQSVDCVFIGDSWTDLYPLDKYYPEINVLNRGIGGDNSYGLLQRLEVSVYAVKPKVVVMLIGGNNINSCREDIEEIIVNIRANLPETKLIMQSTYTVTSDYVATDALVSLCGYIKTLCEKYNLTYVDIYPHLLDSSGNPVDAYHVEDGVHMSEAGYDKITEILKPVVISAAQGF